MHFVAKLHLCHRLQLDYVDIVQSDLTSLAGAELDPAEPQSNPIFVNQYLRFEDFINLSFDLFELNDFKSNSCFLL